MRRVKAVIAYDGASFYGFQRQKETTQTVTTAIEEALKSIGIEDNIRGSGRTDRGVHASNQIIDFRVPTFWRDLNRLREVLNRKLDSIYFKHISYVKASFHSRFSAKRRIYRYIFKTTPISVFEKRYISYYPRFNPLYLQESLRLFEGRYDFSYFIKQGSFTHTNIRTIYRAYYKRYRDYHIIYFEADGFLRSQVRMMIDFSMKVANGKLSLENQQEQLELKQRYSSTLAPPNGLYLARIIY